MYDDRQLILEAQRGDPDAFAEIYTRYQPAVYDYVFYRVGNRVLAEDLTADVFVRVVEKIHTFVFRGRPLLAWLYTIARNIVADHYRRRGSKTLMSLEETLPAESHCAAEATEHCLTQVMLAQAMDQLTEEQRQVILLRLIEGLTNTEASQVLGKSKGVVKSLQHRALSALRRILEKSGYCDES